MNTIWCGGHHAALWRQTKQDAYPRDIYSMEIVELKPDALVTMAIDQAGLTLTGLRDPRIKRVIRNAGTLPIAPSRRYDTRDFRKGFIRERPAWHHWNLKRSQLFKAAEQEIKRLDKEHHYVSTPTQNQEAVAEGLRQGERSGAGAAEDSARPLVPPSL